MAAMSKDQVAAQVSQLVKDCENYRDELSVDRIKAMEYYDGTMGNVNQVTPDGNLTYTYTTQKWKDPISGKEYDLQVPTATQSLSQQQQAIKNQTDAAELNMPALSARQIRLGLVSNGFALAQVTASIDAMPEGVEKETAQIEWEYATTFERMRSL